MKNVTKLAKKSAGLSQRCSICPLMRRCTLEIHRVCFEKYIKDTIPDELSDAVIRLLDLAGLRNISIDDFPEEAIYGASESCVGETFTESIYAISTLPIRYFYEYNYSFESQIGHMLLSIFGLAKHMNIDLIWHVEQKMRYNELRPKLNEKKY